MGISSSASKGELHIYTVYSSLRERGHRQKQGTTLLIPSFFLEWVISKLNSIQFKIRTLKKIPRYTVRKLMPSNSNHSYYPN